MTGGGFGPLGQRCPACKVSAPTGAVFCSACGFRFPQVAAPAPPPMAIATPPPGARRICNGCGALAPIERTSCALCDAAFGPMPLVAPSGADETMWALVWECDFQCRGCGLRSPLDGLDIDGQVECQRCGMNQAFSVEQWEEALTLAHDVADLAGPPTPGSRAASVAGNPYAALGKDKTFAQTQLSGMVIDGSGMRTRSLRVKVSTGHPLCRSCHVPLDVQPDAQRRAVATCPRCRDQATYALPDGAHGHAPSIRAVLGDEHRVDRPNVRVGASPGGGAIAITCPSCNASLAPTADAGFVTCAYCRTVSRIPRATFWKMTHAEPKPQPWWILFQGPSPKRNELLGGTSSRDDDDDDEDRAKASHPQHDPEAAMRAVRERREFERNKQSSFVYGFVALLIAAGVGVGIHFLMQQRKGERRPAEAGEADEDSGSKNAGKQTPDDDEPDPATKAPGKAKGAKTEKTTPADGSRAK